MIMKDEAGWRGGGVPLTLALIYPGEFGIDGRPPIMAAQPTRTDLYLNGTKDYGWINFQKRIEYEYSQRIHG
jgi:hypothetical protein